MASRPSRDLQQLLSLQFAFGRGPAGKKLDLLRSLETGALIRADDVSRLHDLLCFLRAYPDNRAVLSRVERMLRGFADREDLKRFRSELADSGIAGTAYHFPFFWFTLRWLAANWPEQLVIDWGALRGKRRALLDRRLPMLMPYCETLALEEGSKTTREWIETLKGPDETDACFLVRRFEALEAEALPRESIFEENDVPFRLISGPDTPALTECRHDRSPLVFQRRAPVRSRETFWKELRRTPPSVRSVGRGEARRLIHMARTLMVARSRDLDCFVHADDNDVRVMEYAEGFQLVCFGTRPERRQMLDAAYGFLMLRNGVPIGYVLSASLFHSSEVAYNVSPPFRGAEAAHLYARCLNAVRRLFGADTFMVDPYQMGHENPEGLRSGAWWFYYKLGFRPHDGAIARLAQAEEDRVRRERGYRSSLSRLNRLSSVNMYLHLDQPREDIIGEFSRENVGLRIVAYLARRFGSNRERGLATCAREVAELLGLGSLRGLEPAERLAWDRWAPLVLALRGVRDWPAGDRRALARVIRAKGGRRESDFVRRFDRHTRLRQALFELSREPAPDLDADR